MVCIASRCTALALLITWITRCTAVPTQSPLTCNDRYIEKVAYELSEKHLLDNFFGSSINETQPTYIRRHVCCDGTIKPGSCGIPFCRNINSVRCSEEVGECSLNSTVCAKPLATLQQAEGFGSKKSSREPQLQNVSYLETTLKGVPDGHCHIFSGSSVRTFDGLAYSYPLQCRHFMAGMPSFKVDFVSNYSCSSGKCQSAVSISDPTTIVDLLPDGVVNVNDRSVIVPFETSSGIRIYQEGVYKVCRGTDETRVSFDGGNSVIIEVNRLHEFSAEFDKFGLCGNYDLDPTNDLHNRSVKSFVNELNMNQDTYCRKINKTLLNPFDNLDGPNKEKVRRACDDFANQPFLKECRSRSDVQPFNLSCLFLLSRALIEISSFEQVQCDVYAEYSVSCSRVGLYVDWRSKLPNGTCAVSCDHGMVYTECGSACPRTCENFSIRDDCGNECVPGCQCPPGTYFDGEICVTNGSCPCLLAGELYPAGSLMTDGCEDCVCYEGKLQECSTHSCPGTCSIFGGRRFNTFDGKSFEFDGKCEYVLVQSKSVLENSFSIFMDKAKCDASQSRCDRVPEISIRTPDGTQYELKTADTVIVTEDNRPKQDMKLPYSQFAGNSTILFSRPSSIFTKVSMPVLGIELLRAGDNRIYVTVAAKLLGKGEGLCGTFNRITGDDYQLPSGSIMQVSHMFAPKWQSNCNCRSTENGNINDYCEINYKRRKLAEETCGKLIREPFTDCGLKVDPKMYRDMCLHDHCHSQYHTGTECLAFSAYAHECGNVGVNLVWRNSGLCAPTVCEEGMVFKECGSMCKAACRDLGSTDNCQEQCIQGCQCQDNMVYNDRTGKCVSLSQCPCYFKGRDRDPGETWKDKCSDCTCQNGVVHCTETNCSATDKECPGTQKYIECVECQHECQTLHLACKKADCTAGCGCPDGTVRTTDGQCMPETQCPCYFNGRTYSLLQEFEDDCRTCLCSPDAKVVCENKLCPETCRAYGDPHYLTYDGRRYDFQGDCSYVLTSDDCGNNGSSSIFKVVVENVCCGSGGVTCTKSILFTILDVKIYLVRGTEPVITPPESTPTRAKYRIVPSGIFLIISTVHGIKVVWDFGTSIFVTLDGVFKGHVCGLCGDFDGNALNDFRTRGGEIEATPNAFGHSWRTIDSCPEPPDPVHPCEINPERFYWAQSACSIILKFTFSACHDVVDPRPYYDNCVFDSCACLRGGDCECMCTAVSNYADICNKNDVHVSWRSTDRCCLLCEDGKVYLPCGKVCADKCYNDATIKEDYACMEVCEEGCHCPRGKKMWKGKCVDDDECPCIKCVDGEMKCIDTPCFAPPTSVQPTTTREVVVTSTEVKTTVTTTTPQQTTTEVTTVPYTTTKTQICQSGSSMIPDDCQTCLCENNTYYCYKDCHKDCQPGEELVNYGQERCCECVPVPTTVAITAKVPSTTEAATAVPSSTTKGSPPPPPPVCRTYGLAKTSCTRECRERSCIDGNCYKIDFIKDTASNTTLCCECSDGKVYNGTGCVLPQECKCRDENGTLRKPEEKWDYSNNSCRTCKCSSNTIECDRDTTSTGCRPTTTVPTSPRTSTKLPQTTELPTTSGTSTKLPQTTELPTTSGTSTKLPQTTELPTTSGTSTTLPKTTELPTTSGTSTKLPQTTELPTTSGTSTKLPQTTELPTTSEHTTAARPSISPTTEGYCIYECDYPAVYRKVGEVWWPDDCTVCVCEESMCVTCTIKLCGTSSNSTRDPKMCCPEFPTMKTTPTLTPPTLVTAEASTTRSAAPLISTSGTICHDNCHVKEPILCEHQNYEMKDRDPPFMKDVYCKPFAAQYGNYPSPCNCLGGYLRDYGGDLSEKSLEYHIGFSWMTYMCVKIEQPCGNGACLLDGVYYRPGDVVTKGCLRCVCKLNYGGSTDIKFKMFCESIPGCTTTQALLTIEETRTLLTTPPLVTSEASTTQSAAPLVTPSGTMCHANCHVTEPIPCEYQNYEMKDRDPPFMKDVYCKPFAAQYGNYPSPCNCSGGYLRDYGGDLSEKSLEYHIGFSWMTYMCVKIKQPCGSGACLLHGVYYNPGDVVTKGCLRCVCKLNYGQSTDLKFEMFCESIPGCTTTPAPPTIEETRTLLTTPPLVTTEASTTGTAESFCKFEGERYHEGDLIPVSQPCTILICGEDGDIKYQEVKCNRTCPNGRLTEVSPDRCCPVCVPDGRDCSYRKHSSLVVIDDCFSERRIPYTDCEGACPSNSRITILPDAHVSFNCGCCKPKQLEQNYVKMKCNNNTEFYHPYYEIKDCTCQSCENDPMQNLVVNPFML
ncbi:mucin-2-like [Acanthaster planci]|uniref:Mucin-2-like n=1 Tax=Acanthaster planci TaxID=133434 RepID=A0A8B8A4I0_ACAPL|nr:mucin-2-like [Acanthaster planci]